MPTPHSRAPSALDSSFLLATHQQQIFRHQRMSFSSKLRHVVFIQTADDRHWLQSRSGEKKGKIIIKSQALSSPLFLSHKCTLKRHGLICYAMNEKKDIRWFLIYCFCEYSRHAGKKISSLFLLQVAFVDEWWMAKRGLRCWKLKSRMGKKDGKHTYLPAPSSRNF